jgi:hypothetical protein
VSNATDGDESVEQDFTIHSELQLFSQFVKFYLLCVNAPNRFRNSTLFPSSSSSKDGVPDKSETYYPFLSTKIRDTFCFCFHTNCSVRTGNTGRTVSSVNPQLRFADH